MKVESFIARRLRFEGRVAIIAIAISFFVIILAVAISAGFRKEIHSAVLLHIVEHVRTGIEKNCIVNNGCCPSSEKLAFFSFFKFKISSEQS